MSRRWSLFAIGGILLAIFFLVFLFFRTSRSSPISNRVFPTIVPSISPDVPKEVFETQVPSTIPFLIGSIPHDGQVDVSLHDDIELIFSLPVDPSDMAVSVSPMTSFEFVRQSDAHRIRVHMRSPLSPGTRYTISATYRPSPYYPRTISFFTIGPTPAHFPDTAPRDADQMDRSYLEDHPDIFLSNHMPMEDQYVSMTTSYEQYPIGHYVFFVREKQADHDLTIHDIHDWLQSLGMTDAHVQRLDIRYQP